jgi:hypothetical protein
MACEALPMAVETFRPGIRLAVDRRAVEAFHALFDTIAAHGYTVRPGSTGSYNCRKITGGSTLSAHAYGIAVDVNWDTNPYVRGGLVTDMPRAMTDEIQEIRTNEGVRVWRWGGDWDHRPDTSHRFYDAMHFEVIATPAELAVGIPRAITQPRIAGWPTLKRGSTGPAVRHLQELLAIHIDGAFGPKTETAVTLFQRSRGLVVDGVVGPQTWTALEHRLPEVAEDGPLPDKGQAA